MLKFFISLSIILFFSAALPGTSHTRSLLADVNPRKIDIDHNFKGVTVLVYGVRNDAGNVVIAIRGPKEPKILRKKGKVAGVWTNTKSIKLKDFYSYYAIASMRPLETIKNDTLLESLGLGSQNLNFSIPVKKGVTDEDRKELKDAAIRIMQAKKLYTESDYEVSFWGETLFRTFIEFPKNINKGSYNIDVYLFNDGQLTTYQSLPIIVEKVGFEAFMHGLAHDNATLYGIVCVIIAIFFGFLVSTLFGRK